MSQIAPIIYGANFEAQAITTATDLFEVAPATDRPVVVYGLSICQTTDLGDASEEVIRIGLYRDVTAGSTGTAATEYIYTNAAGGATATAAVVTLRGTASTGGTLIDVIGWNVRIPLLWIPIPEMRPKFSAATAEAPFSFRLITAPTDSITASAVLWWAEA